MEARGGVGGGGLGGGVRRGAGVTLSATENCVLFHFLLRIVKNFVSQLSMIYITQE